MIIISRIAIIAFIVALLGAAPASAQRPESIQNSLHLSPKLMKLLRAEMRALLTGVQSLATGIATADWKNVADISARIRASYILNQKLTSRQRKELKTSLPEHFKRLDSYLHLQAKKLEVAATNHNTELATFHYYRLIEACTSCHSIYGTSKFPGFMPATKGSHHH